MWAILRAVRSVDEDDELRAAALAFRSMRKQTSTNSSSHSTRRWKPRGSRKSF